MPGRKPTNLHLIEGTYRRDRHGATEPKPRPTAPAPPKHLDAEARRTWRRLAPILERLGLLTEADAEQFGEFCQAYSRLVAIRREINAGAPIVLEDGKVNPLYVQERHLRDQVRKFAAEFGLTPRGRVGLTVAGTEIDEFADL